MEHDRAFVLPQNNFWSLRSTIKQNIEHLKRKNDTFLDDYDPISLCNDIDKGILQHEEERNLSPLQNKVRKLEVASDLFNDICLLQRDFSSMALTEAVCNVLQESKYRIIARKILLQEHLNRKKENSFRREVEEIMNRKLPDEIPIDGNEESNIQLEERSDTQHSAVTGDSNIHQQDVQISKDERRAMKYPSVQSEVEYETTAHRVANETLQNENLLIEADGTLIENMKEGDKRISDLPQPHFIDVPERRSQEEIADNNLTDILTELRRIENVLADDISELPLDVEGPEGRREAPITGVPEIMVTLPDSLGELPEIIEPGRSRRKKRKPVFDERTHIPHYSQRARAMNRSGNEGRRMVYEGPPSLLQICDVASIMSSSGIKNRFSIATRSSALERLFSRNLKTDKVHHVEMMAVDEQRSESRVPGHEEPVDQTKRDVLEERIAERGSLPHVQRYQLRDVDTSIGVPKGDEVLEHQGNNSIAEQLTRLCGQPVSRILQEISKPRSTVGEPAPLLLPPSPRVQDLQGMSLEATKAEPCFAPVHMPEPNEVWTEYNYVRDCLEDIWKQKEDKGLPKGATFLEVLQSKNEVTKENYLTLIRVVDKMSLRRELILKGHGENISIHPYEVPYVSQLQYSLGLQLPIL